EAVGAGSPARAAMAGRRAGAARAPAPVGTDFETPGLPESSISALILISVPNRQTTQQIFKIRL
ncbi:hypothetical protein, partial [Inquilinus limosus]|uniref:hypothetical protein n=1 Tax=Inquilinus limosus TaxID=171674 RepID=UPI001EE71C16